MGVKKMRICFFLWFWMGFSFFPLKAADAAERQPDVPKIMENLQQIADHEEDDCNAGCLSCLIPCAGFSRALFLHATVEKPYYLCFKTNISCQRIGLISCLAAGVGMLVPFPAYAIVMATTGCFGCSESSLVVSLGVPGGILAACLSLPGVFAVGNGIYFCAKCHERENMVSGINRHKDSYESDFDKCHDCLPGEESCFNCTLCLEHCDDIYSSAVTCCCGINKSEQRL